MIEPSSFLTSKTFFIICSLADSAIIFSIFLLVDFNMIKKREGTLGRNNWETAFEFAFTLYLDMINLLLEILEAMGNN